MYTCIISIGNSFWVWCFILEDDEFLSVNLPGEDILDLWLGFRLRDEGLAASLNPCLETTPLDLSAEGETVPLLSAVAAVYLFDPAVKRERR